MVKFYKYAYVFSDSMGVKMTDKNLEYGTSTYQAIEDGLKGRLFRYKSSLDIHRVEGVDISKFEDKGMDIVAYNLNLNKKTTVPFSELSSLEFVDRDSEGLAKAVREAFKPSSQ